MAPLTWSKSQHVNATPDRVYEWMTDFQEDDHGRPAFIKGSGATKTYTKKPSKRTIVSREGNNVKIKDEWGGRTFEMDLELMALDRTVKMTGPYGYEAVWKAVPDEGGTKVEAAISLSPKGFFRFIMGFFKKRFFRELEQDFQGHIADMENDFSLSDRV
jgi:hypothetical protein